MITPAYAPTATERVLPRLALDFTTAVLDSRVTITRALNTATRVNSSGFIETVNANLPRFDYDPITLAPKGLLIEEQRTNLLTYSEQFDNAAWPIVNITIFANATISPDGTQNADGFVATTNASAFYYRGVTLANGTYTYSLYMKQLGANSTYRFYINDSQPSQAAVNLTFTNGVLSASTATVTGTIFSSPSVTVTNVNNGWYRVALTATSTGSTSPAVALQQLTGRDGTSGIYIWGAQLEAGAFATSYIPTTTTSLTRNADQVTMTGTNFSDWYNASEGTFVVSGYSVYSIDGANPLIYATDGTENNYIRMLANNVSSSGVNAGGVSQAAFSLGAPTANSAANDYAIAYKTDSFYAAFNSSSGSDTSGSVPTIDRLLIGARSSGALMSGTIKRIYFYTPRLPNNQVLTFSVRSVRGA